VSFADEMSLDDIRKTEAAYVHAVRGGQNLVNSNLIIVTPAQGSVWNNADMGANDIMPITWETQDITGDVVITLSRDGGKTWETIADNTANDGSYDWTVIGSVSFNCMLRIEPLADSSKSTTQGLFTINGDSDADGMVDIWEITYLPDLSQNETDDPDGDGLTNLTEYQMGLYPNDADTDNDGMGDGWELGQGFDPYTDDAGGDTDGDGFTDGREGQDQTDPFDPLSHLIFPRVTGRVPDTGQTDCYDDGDVITCPQPGETFYGQDGNFLINTPSYIKMDSQGRYLADAATHWAMVRDNITGLIWEIKQNKDDIEDYTNPNDADNGYTWYNSNYATNGGFAGYVNNDKNTEAFITLLNESNFGGFSDWRLPTLKELFFIVDSGTFEPAFSDYFPSTWIGTYWSSTTGTERADLLDTEHGQQDNYLKNYQRSVRAVRGDDSQVLGRFVVNGDGTVTDTNAGLMWNQKTDDGSLTDKDNQYTWEESLAWAESLNEESFAGFANWRVPNRNELLQLTINETYQPSLGEDYFPHTIDTWHTTSTSLAKWGSVFWRVLVGNFLTSDYTKGYTTWPVNAVRGGQDLKEGNLVIITPLQGSFWKNEDMGSSDVMPIAWETQSLGGEVAIYLSRDSGKTWETIAESTPNDGSHEWIVSGDVSFNCMLKIEPIGDNSKSTQQGLFTINGDSDLDGISDVWEITYFPDLSQNEIGDPDGDGLTNLTEYQNDTNPNAVDTDNDLMDDAWELEYGLEPTVHDSWSDLDGDMFTNGREYQDQTNPQDPVSHFALPEATGRVPDSGQTMCFVYDDPWGWELVYPQPGEPNYGQDGSFLINPPSYLKMDSLGRYLEDSTPKWDIIRDNNTGLFWEVKLHKDNLADHTNPHDADNVYTWFDSNPATNGGFAGTPGNGTDTEDFIQALNTANFGGSSDWRLPTIKELSTIVKQGKYDPSIDATYFPNIAYEPNYWTATTNSRSNEYAGYVSFKYGKLDQYSKELSAEHSGYYVRAVRGGFNQAQDNFIKNGNQTVTDTSSGLMWEQKTDDGSINDWSNLYNNEQAYEWIRTLNNTNFTGYNDWRLPNINELISLIDTHRNPRINAYYFPKTMNYKYLSNTTSLDWWGGFMYVMFRDLETEAMVNDTPKDDINYYIRAVRGGQAQITGHLIIDYPKQGSKLPAGSELQIEWETQEILGDVNVSLSRDGGKTWEVITDSTPNDGEHAWMATDPYSPNCFLKLVPQAEPTKEAIQGLFSITPPDPPQTKILNAPSNLSNATDFSIFVGGDNILSYKFKFNDGSYRDERVVGIPIDLIDLTEGDYSISVIGKNITGDWQSADNPTSITWSVDLTPPQVAEGSILIVDNEGYTKIATPFINLFALDAAEMRFALAADAFSEIGEPDYEDSWLPYATSYSGFDISGDPPMDGEKTIWVEFRDLARNVSIPTADQTIYDTTAPDPGTILIDYEFCKNCGGSEEVKFTRNSYPSIFITGTYADFMRFEINDSEPNPFISGWNPFATVYNFVDLSVGGEGQKTVWAEFKDRLDNIQTVHVSASIYYDSTPPVSTLDAVPEFSSAGAIPLRWSADDGLGSGVADTTLYYKRGLDTFWKTASLNGTSTPFNFTDLSGDGNYYFVLVSTDNLGNREFEPPIIENPENLPNGVYSVLYETVAPESRVTRIDINDVTAEFNVTYTYDDGNQDASQVHRIELWVKGPGDSIYNLVDTHTPEDGGFVHSATTEGAYHFYTIARDRAGNQEAPPDSGYDMMTIYSSKFSGYAIVAVGSIASGEGIEAHTQTANHIYAHLIQRNFALVDDPVARWSDPLDLIKYFNPYTEPQPGEDDYSEDGTISYWDGLRKAITEWAPAKMRVRSGPFYLILVDHGTPDNFYLTGTQTITPSRLNEWVDRLEAEMTIAGIDEEIIIILGTCYAGSFIDELSKPGRIIVASSASDEPSYRGPLDPAGFRDGEFFITSLFNEMAKGENLKSSFLKAVERVEIHTDSGYGNNRVPYFDVAMQHPHLDDDGLLPGSHELVPGGDGERSANLILGHEIGAFDPVTIPEVIGLPNTLLDNSEHSALIWAKVSDFANTDRVWVEIRYPGTRLEGGTKQQLVDLKSISLNPKGDRYEGTYDDFQTEGRYTLFFYVKDTFGLISPFRKSYIYKNTATPNNSPDPFNLLSPNNGAVVPIETILDWEDSNDDTDDHELNYTVTISTDADLANPIYWIYRKEGVEHSVLSVDESIGIQNLTTYYWQVIAIDEYGGITESPVWAFSTDNVTNPLASFINGYVYDSKTNEHIQNATINVGDNDLKGNNDGYYLGIVVPGTYEVSITAPGYGTLNQGKLIIPEGVIVTRNFRISLEDSVPSAAIDFPAALVNIFAGESLHFHTTITGGDPTLSYLWDFDDGATNSNQQDPGSVTFNVPGTYTVTFTVTDIDDDSDNDAITIIVGNAAPDNDQDGISDAIDPDDDNDTLPDTKEYGPNSSDPSYDGNSDGIADCLQDNVVSFHTYDRNYYVTLETPSGVLITDCQATNNPSPEDAPTGIEFRQGFFDFTISGFSEGSSVTLTITLPESEKPDTYYKYGMTPANQIDHWYEYLYNGETGAEINDNIIILHFVDALRGDDKIVPDSMVIDLGAPGFIVQEDNDENDDDGGGGGGGCFMSNISN